MPLLPQQAKPRINRAGLWLVAVVLSCSAGPEPAPSSASPAVQAPSSATASHRGRGNQPPVRPTQPEIDQAIKAMQRARLENDPSLFDQIEQDLEGLLERYPEDAMVLCTIGELAIERASFERDHMRSPKRQLAEAERWFEAALERDPLAIQALNGLATCHEFNRKNKAAVEVDERILAIDPDDLQARLHRGRMLIRLERHDEAIADLEQARTIWHERDASASFQGGPTRRPHHNHLVSIHEQLGRAYMGLGQPERAESILLEAAELVEGQHEEVLASHIVACPYVALGQLYASEGQRDQQAQVLMRAADIEPHKPLLQTDAATACFVAGDLANALTYIDLSLALSRERIPRDLRSDIKDNLLREVSMDAQGCFEAALSAFEGHDFSGAYLLLQQARAQRSEPQQDLLLAYLLLLEGRYVPAESFTAMAARGAAMRPDAATVRAHIAIGEKDYESAERELAVSLPAARRIMAKEGSDLAGYQRVFVSMTLLADAWRLANQSRHSQALARFDEVLTYAPDDVFALLGKANAHNALGEHQLATTQLERLLRIDPDNQYALAELGLVLLNQGDETQAQAQFERALAAQPETYTCPHEGLGLVYLRQGKTDEAKASFEKAIDINPDIEFEKYNGLARIHMDRGEHERARALLEKSLENHPWNNPAKQMLAELDQAESPGAAELQ
jgi:tetratricopeptide (TPR) repeat protein